MLYDLTYIVESKKTELKQNWDTEERLVLLSWQGKGRGEQGGWAEWVKGIKRHTFLVIK